MKKAIILFSLIFAAVAISACKETNEYYYTTPEPDLKAAKIEAVGNIFENIARQPERAQEIVTLAQKTLYTNYEELLPISDNAVAERGEARGYAIGMLFMSIVRMPDALEIMDRTAETMLGVYDKSYISDKLNEYAKASAATMLSEAVARQPDMQPTLEELATKYLNVQFE